MTELYFVDTNLLVYAKDERREPEKYLKAREWLRWLWENRTGRLSIQVLNEYYSVVTQKFNPPLPASEAQADIQDLFAWRPYSIDTDTIRHAWAIQEHYKFNYWDALIIASAKLGGCPFLLTEDMQHDQNIARVLVTNPFLRSPPLQ